MNYIIHTIQLQVYNIADAISMRDEVAITIVAVYGDEIWRLVLTTLLRKSNCLGK
jgi:hypothetical protein